MLVNFNQVLKNAQKGGYAVGLFNTTDTDMLEGVITAAEQNNSPVIIGTAEILLPYGELSLIFPSVIERAKKASVPVVVHYDHGLTFDRCIEAIKLGASSVMFDGSALSYEENVRQTAEMVKMLEYRELDFIVDSFPITSNNENVKIIDLLRLRVCRSGKRACSADLYDREAERAQEG